MSQQFLKRSAFVVSLLRFFILVSFYAGLVVLVHFVTRPVPAVQPSGVPAEIRIFK